MLALNEFWPSQASIMYMKRPFMSLRPTSFSSLTPLRPDGCGQSMRIPIRYVCDPMLRIIHKIDEQQTRNVTTNPPLWNINGGTYHDGKVYFLTNGNSVRGIYTVDWIDGTATPVVNNYRGRHLNSPNDAIVDSKGNIWFTDPAYGWYSAWEGVQAPELPNAVYHFNSTSKALIALSNAVALVPNGLALSADESILYVSDSNSTSGRPAENYPASQRNIWAFDVDGSVISNARMVYQT